MSKVQLECIYTYNKRDQEMITYKKVPNSALDNKRNFVAFMTTILLGEEYEDLVKISACIQSEEKPPQWYMECNGKFYFNNCKLI